MAGNRHALLLAAALTLTTLLIPQTGFAQILGVATPRGTVTPVGPVDACQWAFDYTGVVRRAQILIRRLPMTEITPGTRHEFVFAGQSDRRGTGAHRKLNGLLDQQSVGSNGLAFFAGGTAFTNDATPVNSLVPLTSIANYSIAFVYDLPTTSCDADLHYTATPALELPNGYTVNGRSTRLSYTATNRIAKTVVPGGGFVEPYGYGVFDSPADWESLLDFEYVDWERFDHWPVLPEYQPEGSDSRRYLADEATSGVVRLEAGETAQLVFEFELKIGGWCTGDCAPMQHAIDGNLDEIDDLLEHAHLSVTTLGPDSYGTRSGVRFWMLHD